MNEAEALAAMKKEEGAATESHRYLPELVKGFLRNGKMVSGGCAAMRRRRRGCCGVCEICGWVLG